MSPIAHIGRSPLGAFVRSPLGVRELGEEEPIVGTLAFNSCDMIADVGTTFYVKEAPDLCNLTNQLGGDTAILNFTEPVLALSNNDLITRTFRGVLSGATIRFGDYVATTIGCTYSVAPATEERYYSPRSAFVPGFGWLYNVLGTIRRNPAPTLETSGLVMHYGGDWSDSPVGDLTAFNDREQIEILPP